MKKTLVALSLITVSCGAFAKPYISAGYGVNKSHSGQQVTFSDGNTLTPEKADDIWNVTLGYALSDRFGIELGYNQFKTDDSREAWVQFPSSTNNFIGIDDNWDADLKARQIFVKPVMYWNPTTNFRVTGGLGLTFTDYKLTGNSYRKTDVEIADVETATAIPGVTNPADRSDKKVGLVVSAGADYNLWRGITIGAEASASYDSFATNMALLARLGYRF